MSGVDFSEAIREEFDLKGIIKVLFALCRAHCREEINDTAMGPLLTLAFNRNYLFQQSLSRQKGTRTQKEEGAKRRAGWQKEGNKVWEDNPRWSNTDVGNQVRINLNRKKKRSCKQKGPYIGRNIKKPF
jgi:hypothetical protein